MTNTELAKAQSPRTASAFRVDNRGVLRFITGARACPAQIQSTNVSIRRSTGSTLPLWVGWFIAGLIVNSAMGAAYYGKGYNALQGLLYGAGLVGGPAAILVYRNRKGVFVDVEGSGSLITSIHIGDDTPENEATAYALADAVIEAAKENA
ncbi:MAG: hypothetical protein ACO23C_06820 [Prochlorococcaceae cyanobacterium]